MNRRGFLQGCLLIGVAPAVVRAENLMKLWTPRAVIYTPQYLDLAGSEETMHGLRDYSYRWVTPARIEEFIRANWEPIAISNVAGIRIMRIKT